MVWFDLPKYFEQVLHNLENLRKEYYAPIAYFSKKAAAMTSEKEKEKAKVRRWKNTETALPVMQSISKYVEIQETVTQKQTMMRHL